MKRSGSGGETRALIRKWFPGRTGLQLLVLLAVQLAVYYGAKLLIRGRPMLCMALPADDRIPLLPWTVVIYFGCFLFWAVNYCLILRAEQGGGFRFLRAELLGKLVCFLVFVAVPTTLVRPEIGGTGVFSSLMRLLYSADAPDCLFPSMHCFVSWMCVAGLRGKTGIPAWWKACSAVIAVLVFCATLTTKQHVIVDVFAGAALAELCWQVSGVIGKRRRGTAAGED